MLSSVSYTTLAAREPPSCTFPPGTITCKMWNHTNMDCSYRYLTCIPPLLHAEFIVSLNFQFNEFRTIPENALNGFPKLFWLDLSLNYIDTLHENAFSGLHNLRHLDLSSNFISFIPDPLFHGLRELKYLDISYNEINNFTDSIFQDLVSLQTLLMQSTDVTFEGFDITHALLASLQITFEWDTLPNCSIVEKSFTSLKSRTYLYIRHRNHVCFNYDIYSLSSLQTVIMIDGNINTTDDCFKKISLISFDFLYLKEIQPPYEVMNYLTNLSVSFPNADINTAMQSLHLLDSPLQSLSITMSDANILDDTTFELLEKFNESMNYLKIHCFCDDLWLFDAPFQWFPNLRYLLISRSDDDCCFFLSKDNFKGLPELRELHLNIYHAEIFESAALKILSTYKFFHVLDLSNNLHNGWIKDQHQLCSITSLQKLDMSSNSLLSFTNLYFGRNVSCPLPNLKTLFLGGTKTNAEWSPGYFCLTKHVQNVSESVPSKIAACPKLVILDLSKNTIIMNKVQVIYLPTLKELYLHQVKIQFTPWAASVIFYVKDLHVFKAPQLRHLDLSSNKIAVIDEQNVFFLSNLTSLNLRNNRLTVTSTLEYLEKISILLLGGNKISFVPKSFLSKLSRLNSLDLSDNPFLCDCSVETLQKWITSNKRVKLDYDYGVQFKECVYCCSSPESTQGLSLTEIVL